MRYFLRLLSPVWGTAVRLGAIHAPLPKTSGHAPLHPQTLNRSIRHTMLRTAGVWAVAVGAYLVPRPEACTLSQTHTRSCTPFYKSDLLLCVPFKDNRFILLCSVFHCPVADFCFARFPLTRSVLLSPHPTRPATDLHHENTHKAYLPICSVADSDYAPPASHLSRVYPNMKINSQLNAAICSQRGKRWRKIKHRFTLVNSLRIKKESLKAGRVQCSLMCKANVTVKSPPCPCKEHAHLHKLIGHFNREKSCLAVPKFTGYKKLT